MTYSRGRENTLLARLPGRELQGIFARSQMVDLRAGDVIADPEREITDVYFPTSAVLSVLSVATDRSGVETAVIGHEGMAPLAAFHGTTAAAEQIVVQVPGAALRFTVQTFRELLSSSPTLERSLHRFAQALFTFAAQSSGCNRRHSISRRCARWLLLAHDRVRQDEFPLTHLFLAQMLGVRRSSVTIAAEKLRALGAIRYSRGRVRILDRDKLLGEVCECYAVIRATYDRLLGDGDNQSPLVHARLSEDGESLAQSVDRRERRGGNGSVSAMADVLPDAFLQTDADGRITAVNVLAEELFGAARHELVGRYLLALVPDAERWTLTGILEGLRRGDSRTRWSGSVNGADGNVRVDGTVSPTPRDGSEPVGPDGLGSSPGATWLIRARA